MSSLTVFIILELSLKKQICDVTQLHSHDFYRKICSNDSQTSSAFF